MRHLERFENLVVMFFARAREKGDAPFLWAKKQGKWQSLSWREAAEKVAALAAALRSFGLERGDRVMLVGENRPEWLISDLAIMASGCVTVPTYTTNTERDHQHILDDSGARAVIVSTAEARENPAARRDPLEQLRGGDRDGAAARRAGAQRRLSRLERADRRAEGRCRCLRGRGGGLQEGRARLHHLHVGHGRRAARRDAASRRHPPQYRGLHRAHLGGFRLGRRGLPVLPPGQPRLRAQRRADVPDRAWRPDLFFGRAGEARFQYRGGTADDHGRRAAPVRGAADPHPEAGRETGRLRQLSDAPQPEHRRQGGFGPGAALGQADGLLPEPDAAAQGRGEVRRADQGHGLGRGAAQPRGRDLLPVAGAHPVAGLWPDRIRPRPVLQPAECRPEDGHGRPAAAEHRGEDRGGRRDPGARRARDAGLLAQRADDRADDRRRLAAHGRCRPSRRAKAGSSSPTARRI